MKQIVTNRQTGSPKPKDLDSQSIFEDSASRSQALADWAYLKSGVNGLTIFGQALARRSFVRHFHDHLWRNAHLKPVVFQTVLGHFVAFRNSAFQNFYVARPLAKGNSLSQRYGKKSRSDSLLFEEIQQICHVLLSGITFIANIIHG
jgi:hypothetical protein